MEHELVKDVLAEADHMGFNEGSRRQPSKQLLNEFGFTPNKPGTIAAAKRHMEDIQDITTYFQEMTGKNANNAEVAPPPPSVPPPMGRRRGADSDGPEMQQYKAIIQDLSARGAADNIRKTKWTEARNDTLAKRMVSCVANATQEVQSRCKERIAELGKVGVFSSQINEARAEALYHTELLRKLRLEALSKDAVRLVDASTPKALAEVLKANLHDSFELALESHIRDKDDEIEAKKEKAAREAAAAAQPRSRRRSEGRPLSGRRMSKGVNIMRLTGRVTPAKPPAPPTASKASSRRASGATPVPGAEEAEAAGEQQHQEQEQEQQCEEAAGAEEAAEAGEVEAAHEDEWDQIDQYELREQERLQKEAEALTLKKRRRRRKRMPPDYVEYAQLRQQQMDEEDAKQEEVSKWVKESEQSRARAAPPRATKSAAARGEAVASPFDRVANDVLLPKHTKKELAMDPQWEDVKVSDHVVLRTSKPTAAPRVPQLLVNPPSYDSVRSGEVDANWLVSGNSTSEMRTLIADIYHMEASAIIGEADLLPGAAPADFEPLANMTPALPSKAQLGAPKPGGSNSHTIRATLDAELPGSQSTPSIDIAVQRRLEKVWNALEVPPMEKLDHVLKYGRPEFAHNLESSLREWEKAAACVKRRETLLKELNNLKNSSSAINGSQAVGERMQRLAVAVCEQTRDCLKVQATLLNKYADILKYRGLSYSSKLKRDMDQELISLLPQSYDLSDLQIL